MSTLLDSLLDAERKGQCAWFDEALAKSLKATDQRKAWMFVGAAFQQASPHCEDCNFCAHKGQMHPYGEGEAYEAWQECTLGQSSADKPEQCPAYASFLESERGEEA